MNQPETSSNKNDRLLKYGLIGTVVAALCCFTPILVILLGAVGLSALLGWLDIVLLPALAVFIGITLYALWRRQRTR
ncbi:MAG: mercury resistance system transport protein MerF [Limimaricola soesokkakensis]|uniref:mercury resistance system transport protein MerF n=1 Tax=Limimaricola soesokkakensis TaxID=1343159 RepID=UPI004059FE17